VAQIADPQSKGYLEPRDETYRPGADIGLMKRLGFQPGSIHYEWRYPSG